MVREVVGLIEIRGLIGAAEAAVDAGKAAAKKIGELVGVYIIPKPDPDFDFREDKRNTEKITEIKRIIRK